MQHLRVPEPSRWPGASDPSLSRPDRVKFELATFATSKEPGKSKTLLLEKDLKKGVLGLLPELYHWAMEEFLWHSRPGDSWHPVEAFLAREGDRFPPPAQEQLRRWKEATLSTFEIGGTQDETVELRPWDVIKGTPTGAPIRAITLNIGGINLFTKEAGRILLSYLAPWLPAENLYCGMGYSLMVPKREAVQLIPILWLRHMGVVSRPLPWKVNRATVEEYRDQWLTRDWHRWLGDRLRFPFQALIPLPPSGKLQLCEVTGLVPSTPRQAYQFGIYLEVPEGTEMIVVGGTAVTPVDVQSTNMTVLREYQDYRDWAGPPPGTVGQPSFTRLR
jgi:hypothetical protein